MWIESTILTLKVWLLQKYIVCHCEIVSKWYTLLLPIARAIWRIDISKNKKRFQSRILDRRCTAYDQPCQPCTAPHIAVQLGWMQVKISSVDTVLPYYNQLNRIVLQHSVISLIYIDITFWNGLQALKRYSPTNHDGRSAWKWSMW